MKVNFVNRNLGTKNTIYLLESCNRFWILKVITSKIQTSSIILIVVVVVGIILPNVSYAELYQNFDRTYLTEEQYVALVYECSILQENGGIDKSIECADWVLTEEGNNRIHEYINFKFFGGE